MAVERERERERRERELWFSVRARGGGWVGERENLSEQCIDRSSMASEEAQEEEEKKKDENGDKVVSIDLPAPQGWKKMVRLLLSLPSSLFRFNIILSVLFFIPVRVSRCSAFVKPNFIACARFAVFFLLFFVACSFVELGFLFCLSFMLRGRNCFIYSLIF